MAMTTQASLGAPATKKMKMEHGSAPNSAPSTPQIPQSKSGTPAPTWNASQIPIDPALQQAPSAVPTPTGTPGPSSAQNQQAQNAVPLPYMVNRGNYAHYTAYGGSSTYYAMPSYSFQNAQTPTFVATPTQANVAPKQQSQQQQAQASQSQSQQQQSQQAEQETNVDVATLNDAIGSAGLDLRAEEETLQRSQDHHASYRSYEDRSRKQPANPSFDTRILSTAMRNIGTNHKVTRIPDDSVNYVALALRARLQTLIEGMIAAANHRAKSQFDREPGMYNVDGIKEEEDEEQKLPMWKVLVRRDTRKILEVLERVEREEEMRVRRERRERADAAVAAAAQASQAASSPVLEGVTPSTSGAIAGDDASSVAGDTPGPTPAKKAKKKKDGPGVTARNMSEDVQKRLSNAVATQAAGLGRGKYAWMNAGGAAASPGKPKASKTAPKESTPAPATATAATPNGTEVAAATTANGALSSQPSATNASSPTPSQSQTVPASGQQGAPAGASGSSWAKPYVSAADRAKAGPSSAPGDENKMVVTLRDAMFVIERERGHGAGRGAARAWV